MPDRSMSVAHHAGDCNGSDSTEMDDPCELYRDVRAVEGDVDGDPGTRLGREGVWNSVGRDEDAVGWSLMVSV